MNKQQLGFQEKGDVLDPSNQEPTWTPGENSKQLVSRIYLGLEQTSDQSLEGTEMCFLPKIKGGNENHTFEDSREEVK